MLDHPVKSIAFSRSIFQILSRHILKMSDAPPEFHIRLFVIRQFDKVIRIPFTSHDYLATKYQRIIAYHDT